MRTIIIGAIALGFGAMAGPVTAQDATPARLLFAGVQGPAPPPARAVGAYSRGCLGGAVALAPDGPGWQAMRLSRNRNWGMPQLVSYVEKLARDVRERDRWPGLLVGDLSQPRGGPMASDHSSHQIGLDVDIWLTPMPDRTLTAEERDTMPLRSLIKPGTNTKLDPALWDDGIYRLIRRAASYDEVQHVLVNPGIKAKLCKLAGRDRAWLRKVRPWYKHDDHLHVRLDCPKGMAGCRPHKPPPKGDGCGLELAWWLGPGPYKPKPKPTKPALEMMLADLPTGCTDILMAGGGTTEAGGGTTEAGGGTTKAGVAVPMPVLRPNPN